ncbi:MAG: hypothetical protein IT285_01020 [Bdellovibrionales bacterium]|nr:hypothetical protein [Bdellovibrionales bacterium]
MKRISLRSLALALAIAVLPSLGASASQDVDLSVFAELLRGESRDLINWKVGDSADYTVKMGPLGSGTMKKFVKSEEDGAIWVRQEIAIMSQNQVVEMLMRRSDGQILKLVQNGQEQPIPEESIEIISTNFEQVTVPAGTFDSIHIVANTSQAKNIEVWANPDLTVMDGALKQIVPTSFVKMTIELVRFHKVP